MFEKEKENCKWKGSYDRKIESLFPCKPGLKG